jgi:hypothetical protein
MMQLCHGDCVGDDAVGLEALEVAADAGEPRRLVHQRQVPRRQLHRRPEFSHTPRTFFFCGKLSSFSDVM